MIDAFLVDDVDDKILRLLFVLIRRKTFVSDWKHLYQFKEQC